jgi:hypothetical protein
MTRLKKAADLKEVQSLSIFGKDYAKTLRIVVLEFFSEQHSGLSV